MDEQQKQSIIKHVSQKIFINKVSRTGLLHLSEKEAHEAMRDFAGEALTAAKIYAEEIELDSQYEDLQDDTDSLT